MLTYLDKIAFGDHHLFYTELFLFGSCLFFSFLLHPLFQSSWQTRRFRGRKKWYWRGRRRKRPGRRWGHGSTMSRHGWFPPWWKLTTRPTMPPILISLASGWVRSPSFFPSLTENHNRIIADAAEITLFPTVKLDQTDHGVMSKRVGFPEEQLFDLMLLTFFY